MSFISVLCFLTCSSVVLGKVGTITNALLGQHPYVVSLQDAFQRLPNSHICSGTIISPSWIVTSAKCVYGRQANSLNIVAGTVQLGSGGTTYKIDEIIVHEDYDPESYKNNIALLHTNTSIAFPRLQLLGIDTGRIVSSIKLKTDVIPKGTVGVVSTWVKNSNTQNQAQNTTMQLVYSSVPVADKSDRSCAPYRINNNKFCAGNNGAALSSNCQGDSGGPVVYEGNVIGIVSYASECNSAHLSGVYENIAGYKTWIKVNSGV